MPRSKDAICKPYSYGGLGIKNLRLQGLALRVRWEWMRRTWPDKPWQGLAKFNDEEMTNTFDSLVKVEGGNGSRILFKSDRWINGMSAESIAPGVTAKVLTRKTKQAYGGDWHCRQQLDQ